MLFSGKGGHRTLIYSEMHSPAPTPPSQASPHNPFYFSAFQVKQLVGLKVSTAATTLSARLTSQDSDPVKRRQPTVRACPDGAVQPPLVVARAGVRRSQHG
jgi:hypothetical protein